MAETKIDFIRHGEPVGGRCFRGYGIDDPLSEKGWMQMWAAVDGASAWGHVISSPLQRCRKFAEELADRQGISLSLEYRFKEVGFGLWEGRSPEEIEQSEPEAYAAFYRDPIHNRPEEAEPWAPFSARVSAALDDVCKKYSGQHVLVVAHAGVIRAAAASVLEASATGAYRMKIDNAGFSQICHDGKKYRLAYLNREN